MVGILAVEGDGGGRERKRKGKGKGIGKKDKAKGSMRRIGRGVRGRLQGGKVLS